MIAVVKGPFHEASFFFSIKKSHRLLYNQFRIQAFFADEAFDSLYKKFFICSKNH